MQRTPTRNWLNLLLVIVMVIGPWPVLSETTSKVSDCCVASMEMAEDMRHAGCGNQPDQEECCMDQGCSGSNCSVTVYISTDLQIEVPVPANAFALLFGVIQPTGATAPPIPPPIV